MKVKVCNILRQFISCAGILSLMVVSPFAVFGSEVSNEPDAVMPMIKKSAGKDCFKSLGAADMEILGNILYSRNNLMKAISPDANKDYTLQKQDIDKHFSGAKKVAAYALLSNAIAKTNQALLKQVMNQSLYRDEKKLNDNDKKLIKNIIVDARKNGLDLEDLLNKKISNLWDYAQVLKSKGAKLTPNGEWNFDKDFNFEDINRDPKLKNALSAFFPDEVKELSFEGRGFAIIGNRAVQNVPDPKGKDDLKNKQSWVWKSDDVKSHFKKILEIEDRFFKKAEEYARLSKENNNWAVITGAALDTNAYCGISLMKVIPEVNSIRALAQYFSGKKLNMRDSWDAGLKSQIDLQEDLGKLIIEMSLYGASSEVTAEMRSQLSALTKNSNDDLDKGLVGMKRAMTAIACAPLAAITAPISLPAAGTTGATAFFAYAGFTLTAVGLTTPAVLAAMNIAEASKSGDGLLCSMVKEGAILPVKYIEALKWGAMAPVLKGLEPYADKLIKIAKPGPKTLFVTLNGPKALMVGTLAADKVIAGLKNREAIANLEEALRVEEKSGNTAHAEVIKEILKNAKEERWDIALGLAMATVSIHDIINNALNVQANNSIPVTKTENTEVATASAKNPALVLSVPAEATPATTPVTATTPPPPALPTAPAVTSAPALSAAPVVPVAPIDVPLSPPPISNAIVTPLTPAQILPGSLVTSAQLTVAAVDKINVFSTKHKNAEAGEKLSVSIDDINPGQSVISKDEVSLLVDRYMKEATIQYPDDPKAIDKYIHNIAISDPLLVDVLPDGTLILKNGYNILAAFQSLIDQGVLNKNEFMPNLITGHNYYTDPDYSNKSKDVALETILKKMAIEKTIYIPEKIKLDLEAGKITYTQAFKLLPTKISKVNDRPEIFLIDSLQSEMGIPLGNINEVLDFYSSKNLGKFQGSLSKNFDVKNVESRAKIISQLLLKPSYISLLKGNIPEGGQALSNASLFTRKEWLARIDQLAKYGPKYYASYESFLRSLIKANPLMKDKILKIKLVSFEADLPEKKLNSFFMEHAVQELGMLNHP